MDELRQSSLLFSLEGLLETERERVQREAREAQKRRDDELARVAELAERRRRATQLERESRERRELLERERERLEGERIEAMKRATVERARIEAEGQMRLVEAEQVRKHDLALSALREGQRTARYRSLTWLSTGALVFAMGGAFSAYFGLVAPAHARELSELQRLLGTSAEQRATTERALTSERNMNHTLSVHVDELKTQLAAANAAKPASNLRPPVRPTTVIHTTPPPPTDCPDDGDPLRPCLRRGAHTRN